MFAPRTDPQPEHDKLALIVRRVMGWPMHSTSGHRPGTRDIPHGWLWRQSGQEPMVMIYLGGSGPEANVHFDPIGSEAVAREIQRHAEQERHIGLPMADLASESGRRAFVDAVAAMAADLEQGPGEQA